MGNRQIGGAAADIDRGDAQAFARHFICFARTIRARGAAKEILRATGEVDLRFVEQPYHLAAGGFVPLHLHVRHRFAADRRRGGVERLVGGVPALGFPHQRDRLLHAAAENFALRLRHRGRQGKDDVAQLARRVALRHALALRGAVHLHQRLRQQLAQHKGHQRAAAVVGGKDRQAIVVGERVQRLAFVVQQKGKGRGVGLRLVRSLRLIKAPAWLIARLVPQIAARAGDAGAALKAGALQRQAARFAADARQRRPHKGVFAAALQ